MSKIKCVIFDLDNTLVITKPAAKEGYKQAIYYLAKQHKLEKQKDKLYNHWKRIVQQLAGENKPYKRRFEYSLKQLLQDHQIPETYFSQALHVYEKTMLSKLNVQNGAKELITWLKEANVKIAVATGSDRAEAVKKLKAVGLYSYLDLIVTPNEIEAMQPDPRYYELILKELHVSPSQTFVIGDNQQEDLDPATSLKLQTYLIPASGANLVAVKSIISESSL